MEDFLSRMQDFLSRTQEFSGKPRKLAPLNFLHQGKWPGIKTHCRITKNKNPSTVPKYTPLCTIHTAIKNIYGIIYKLHFLSFWLTNQLAKLE